MAWSSLPLSIIERADQRSIARAEETRAHSATSTVRDFSLIIIYLADYLPKAKHYFIKYNKHCLTIIIQPEMTIIQAFAVSMSFAGHRRRIIYNESVHCDYVAI